MAPLGNTWPCPTDGDGPELSNSSLVVHYQPIVELTSRDVRLVEALARLEVGGVLLAPGHWVPLAEHTGDIDRLGCRVLRTAVEDMLGGSGSGSGSGDPRRLGLSVNVSPQQLHGHSLIACVEKIGESGVAVERLCLEITESAVVDDTHSMQTVRALRALGCRIAMDDFGTGYSSLHALTELPVDVLKVDRRLVERLPGPKATAVLAFVLELARALDMEVVAEGVETRAQLETLVELGCTLGQGYLLGLPGPLDTVVERARG